MTFKFQVKKKEKPKNIIFIELLNKKNPNDIGYSFNISFDYDKNWKNKLSEIINKIDNQNNQAFLDTEMYFELTDIRINFQVFSTIIIKEIIYYNNNSEEFLIDYYPLSQDLSKF